jgi:hypothetical protein
MSRKSHYFRLEYAESHAERVANVRVREQFHCRASGSELPGPASAMKLQYLPEQHAGADQLFDLVLALVFSFRDHPAYNTSKREGTIKDRTSLFEFASQSHSRTQRFPKSSSMSSSSQRLEMISSQLRGSRNSRKEAILARNPDDVVRHSEYYPDEFSFCAQWKTLSLTLRSGDYPRYPDRPNQSREGVSERHNA